MRGRPTSKETREKIISEYQNGATIINLMRRYKLSDKTVKRIVGIYEFDYSKKNNDKNNVNAENIITEYINNRIASLNEQIIKLSNEKMKLQEFNDYLIKADKGDE